MNVRSCGLATSIVLSIASLCSAAPDVLPALPPAAPDGLTNTTMLHARLARQLGALAPAELAAAYPLLRFEGVSQARAEALFSYSRAAAYFADTGEVLALVLSGPDTVLAGGLRTTSPGVKALGPATLLEFVAEVGSWTAAAGDHGSHVLVMTPVKVSRPVPESRREADEAGVLAPAGVVLQEGFESNPFAGSWQRWDSFENGQFTWGTTPCNAHTGTYSADAIRGGSMAGSLTCTSAYPEALSTWMWDTRCNSVQGASQAWLDLFLTTSTVADHAALWVTFTNGNEWPGYGFTGTWSGWWHAVFDLRQWPAMGDLTTLDCIEVNVALDADETAGSGWGARVDDIAIRTDAPPFLTCTGTATPASGPPPLTVSLTGSVTNASGNAEFRWWFGDTQTSTTAQSTTHTYNAVGDYYPRLVVTDGTATCSATPHIQVTAGCSLSCSATVPSTTAAGTPTGFQATATPNGCGAVAPTFLWSFGDGSTSTEPNPNHTYASGGTFTWVLTVTAGGTTCTRTGSITVTQSCALTCTATVAATGQAGSPVSFQATATPVNCGGATPSFVWGFGDGSAAAEQSPSHTYTSPGTYSWTMTAMVDGIPCTRSGSITVSAAPPPPRRLVPAVAQTSGVGGTQWRTGVAVVNRSTTVATLELAFVSATSTERRTTTVPSHGTIEWGNILSELFGITAETSGALQITSDVEIQATARTYNQTPAGTFGQYYPALTEANALRTGQTGVLPQLKKNAAYRTNLGVANLGTSSASVLIALHGPNGVQLGSSKTITVDAGRWFQQSDIFGAVGATNQDIAYATAQVQGASDLVWVYASVIDNVTGDPTTIPVVWDATRGTVIGTTPPREDSVSVVTSGDDEGAAVDHCPGSPTDVVVDYAATGEVVPGDFVDLLGALATPEDGTYLGKTTPQNRDMGILVEGGAITRVKVSYTCGGSTSALSVTYSTPCPIVNGSFSCGSAVCVVGSSLRVSGTFSTPTTVSGLFDVGYKPVYPPGSPCCQVSNLGYSASKSSQEWLKATATASPTSGPPPLTVAFTGAATGGKPPYTWDWSFFDGGTSTLQNPTHTYTKAGSYTAFFTAHDSVDDSATDSVRITVATTTTLQATAAANPTSGAAPLAVQLTGAATGGTAPYSWLWSFGDGSTSTQQSPSHTFSSAGTYQVTLTVVDSASATATANVSISVTSPPFQAAATANPSSGAAPLEVAFTGSASGGTPPYTWIWSFGDGGAAAAQSPGHTYTSAGTYQATLVVTDSASRTATANVTVTVTAAVTYRYLLPGVAHNPGVGGTMWRTSSAAVNRGASDALLRLRFTGSDGSTIERALTLPSGTTHEWSNILETLFGLASSTSSSGIIEVTSSTPIFITSRTFNQTASGTYGQYYPSLTATEGLGPGRLGVLPQLKKNASFRTNIGVVNLGTAPCTALIKLHGATGTQVGVTKQLAVDPGRWRQQTDIFADTGAGNQNVAYATVEVQGASDLVWAYASVIDGSTGDPTTIPLLITTP